jgi:lipopolysaccharide transport system ATP-binding protein
MAIQINHLSKHFAKRKEKVSISSHSKEKIIALDDISFTIHKGEAVGIIGRNGSGKSTLLKILSGVYPQTSGEIIIHGKVTALLESGIGFHKDLSGYDNILIFGRILGVPTKIIKERINEIVDFAELSEYLYMPIKHYSNGMVSRLSFSVIQFLMGDILLIDEVLAFGDISFQHKAIQYLKQQHSSGKTLLLVSHHINTLISLCNRFIVLQNGKYVNDGPPLQIIPNYYEELLLAKSEHKNNLLGDSLLQKNVIEFNPPFALEDIAINKVQVLPSKKGNIEFNSGEEIVLELEMLVKSPKSNEFDVGIIVRDIMQNMIFSASLGQQQLTLKSDNSPYKLYLKIENNILNAGIFFFNFFIINLKTKEYRFSNQQVAIRILAESSIHENESIQLMSLLGSIKIPITWEF